MEALTAVLKERGLNEQEITEIIVAAQVTKSTRTRRRAKLTAVSRVDEATLQQFRQELLLREWEKRVRSRLRPDFQATGVQISPSRAIVVFRQDNVVTMAEVRFSVGRRSPFNRRFIAQKIPQVKSEGVELVRLVVSDQTGVRVLTTVGRQSGVRLPESERKWLIASLRGEVVVRLGQWQKRLPKSDWQQILRSWRQKYRLIEHRWHELEISADGQNWFKVSQLLH